MIILNFKQHALPCPCIDLIAHSNNGRIITRTGPAVFTIGVPAGFNLCYFAVSFEYNSFFSFRSDSHPKIRYILHK